jgi:hypothetical protein
MGGRFIILSEEVAHVRKLLCDGLSTNRSSAIVMLKSKRRERLSEMDATATIIVGLVYAV